MPKSDRHRVVMSKQVAYRWLLKTAKEEHVLTVLYGSRHTGRIASYIRAFRDNKATLQGVPTIPDLGVEETFDGLRLWSSDRSKLVSLKDWFEKRGYETTGIW